MDLLLWLAVIAVVIILWNRLRKLGRKVERLEGVVARLQQRGAREQAQEEAEIATAATDEEPIVEAARQEALAAEAVVGTQELAGQPEQARVEPRSAPANGPQKKEFDWERTLGVRLPVWSGAIMLLIAGYFLINWAIEAGIASVFTPEVRVILCGVAAVALLAAAFVVKARGIANGDRIGAALAASSIAIGYGTMFLAAAVFDIVPGPVALSGAVAVTLVAIGVAFRFDRRVMLVGLLGGYLSPLFVWFDADGPSTGIVAIYVAALLAASVFAIRRNGWWEQVLPALVGPTAWASALLLTRNHVPLVVLDLTIAAIPTAIALLPLQDDRWQEGRRRLALLSVMASAAVLALGSLAFPRELAYPVGQVILSVGGALLVFHDPSKFRPAWIATLASALVGLLVWSHPSLSLFAGICVSLAGIHLGSLVTQYRADLDRTRRSFEISGLTSLMLVIAMVKLDGWIGARDLPYLWAAIGFALCGAFAYLSIRTNDPRFANGPRAGFLAGASALLSLALGLVLDPGLYALVAALQAFGLAVLYYRLRIPVLLVMHAVYAGLYAALVLVGEVVSGVGDLLIRPMPVEGVLDFVPAVSIREEPITLLLIPGLLALGASSFLARAGRPEIVRMLDFAAVALLAGAFHFLILPEIPADVLEQAFVIGSLWFNVLAGLALANVYAGARFGRHALAQAGIMLAWLVAAAMLVWAIIPVFEFWPTIMAPGLPVLNAALTGLATPAVLLLAVAYLARHEGQLAVARGLAAFGGLAGMVTVLVLIRQILHGPTLNGPGTLPLQIELYLYSAGMLVYGFVLLWGGAVFSSIALRAGSLLVVLATIGKVFLYDVSGLEGLWRVGSFLGMGLALLAVSWFYGRFVFGIGPSGKRHTDTVGAS